MLTLSSLFGWIPYIVQDMWARILEDQAFLNHYLSEGQRRLARNYKICTDILAENKILYYPGGNSVLFVWVDLRSWFLGDNDASNFQALKMTSTAKEQYLAKEDRLIKTWLDKRVMIAKGSAFYSEELGWFRIVFTAEEEGLRLGMQKFIDGLKELKQKGEL